MRTDGRNLFLAGRNFRGFAHTVPDRTYTANSTQKEAGVDPDRQAAIGARNVLLEDKERHVGQGDAQSRKETLGEVARAVLLLRKFVGNKRAVGLHSGIVGCIEHPKQTRSHPQGGTKGIDEQRQAAQQGTDKEKGLAATKAGGPGLVTQGANDGLDEQSCHGTSQIQDGQLVRGGSQHVVDGVDRALLQAKGVLDSKESDVHVNDLGEREGRFCHASRC